MTSEQWRKYSWLDDESLNNDLMAGCLGVVIGVDEATVRRQLAVDEGSRREATAHEAQESGGVPWDEPYDAYVWSRRHAASVCRCATPTSRVELVRARHRHAACLHHDFDR
jgi:hypothetical protein